MPHTRYVIVGKTNMTEFAYSAFGVNPHYGTPLSPWDRARGHVPGGSTSGGAVGVADAMTPAALGTDTGGSCRIPAAFCGIVGFRPTQGRISREGVLPLAPSLDSVGPLATSVSCCAALDSVLSGGPGEDEPPQPLAGLAIGVIEGYVDESLDASVAAAFADALARLARAGAKLTPVRAPELTALPQINRNGSIVEFEAFAVHRARLATSAAQYDPWVRAARGGQRKERGGLYRPPWSSNARPRRGRRANAILRGARPSDGPIAPPALDELGDFASSRALNALILRNTAIANFLDRPAISIPCHAPGGAPVGFMLMGETGLDRRLLAAARGAEEAVRGRP
jgi:aspartyl-tRNA(Asn)/glutamyl-tRNA(Gln) amidotransferase subunit A